MCVFLLPLSAHLIHVGPIWQSEICSLSILKTPTRRHNTQMTRRKMAKPLLVWEVMCVSENRSGHCKPSILGYTIYKKSPYCGDLSTRSCSILLLEAFLDCEQLSYAPMSLWDTKILWSE